MRSVQALKQIRKFASNTVVSQHNRHYGNYPSTPAIEDAIHAEDVLAAYERIKGVVARSPLDYSKYFSDLTGSRIYLKKEHSASVTGSTLFVTKHPRVLDCFCGGYIHLCS